MPATDQENKYNLDNFRDQGNYVVGAIYCDNAPIDYGSLGILVINYGWQLCSRQTSTDLWFRTSAGSEWTNWQKIA